MIKRNNAADYRLENVVDEKSGRIVTRPVYRGDWYSFKAPADAVARAKKTFLLGTFLLAAFYFAAFLLNAPVSRVSYVLLPLAVMPIFLFYQAAGVRRLWAAKERVTREHCAKIHDRLAAATLSMAILTGCSAAGHAVSWVLHGETGADVVFLILTAGMSADAVWLFRRRESLKMEKSGTARMEDDLRP